MGTIKSIRSRFPDMKGTYRKEASKFKSPIYFKECSAPTVESFFLLLLSMLVLESADSI